MLDLSDKRKNSFEGPPSQEGKGSALLSDPAELPTLGSIYRHLSGDLIRIEQVSINLDKENGLLVTFKNLDPLKNMYSSSCSLSTLNEIVNHQRIYQLIEKPSKEAFLLSTSFIPDFVLKQVLEMYSDFFRYYHSKYYLYDLFDKAQKQGIPLSKEQVCSILFHNVGFNPASSTTAQTTIACGIFDLYKHFLSDVDNALVHAYITAMLSDQSEDENATVLVDLKYAHLADESLMFSVYNELIWLETRHLLNSTDQRKDFDSRRLRYLIEKVQDSKKIYKVLLGLEDAAKINIEGMRKAWVQKYKKNGIA